MNKLIELLLQVANPITGMIVICGLMIYYFARKSGNSQNLDKLIYFASFIIMALFGLQFINVRESDKELSSLKTDHKNVKIELDSLKMEFRATETTKEECFDSKNKLEDKLEKETKTKEILQVEVAKFRNENKHLDEKLKSTQKELKNKYKWIGQFLEGKAVVQSKSNKFGYIDKRLNEITPCMFKNAAGFSNGFAGVMNIENKWGFIDQLGNLRINYQFDDAIAFNKFGTAVIRRNEHWYQIDKKGNIIKVINK